MRGTPLAQWQEYLEQWGGENLTYAQDPNAPFAPRAWRVDDNAGQANRAGARVAGICYSDPGDTPGTTVKATVGQFVPVVVNGITKAVVDAAIGVGDIVVGADTLGRVKLDNTPTAGKMLGKCLSATTAAGQVADILVDLG